MPKFNRRSFIALIAAALLAATSTAAPASNAAPVRVAVFVGPGARGVGMFRWMQLVDQAPELRATYVDGAAVRAGALRAADLVVMPGGSSGREAADLGAEGRAELRRFIEEGGAYVGTCAGAFLLMRGDPGVQGKRDMLGLAPYRNRKGSWGGEAMLQVAYTKEAEALCGIKAGTRMERFHGGPVMDPVAPLPGADFKVMARFKCNLHTGSMKPGLPSMAGGASAVAGTFGKGRVWLFSCHPEYYPQTWGSVKAAFKYLTGRDVAFSAPQRKKGQLAVAWFSKPSPGPAAAELARALVRDDDFDVVPYSNDEVKRTDLRHVDALVVPDVPDAKVLAKCLSANGILNRLTAYMDRGGKVVAWGGAAKHIPPHANLVVAPSAQAVPGLLRGLKDAPLPAPRTGPAPQATNPVRVAAYFDDGAGGCAALRWVKLLSLSPDCAFTAVDAADVRAGALANADLYVAPGGSSSTQAKTLQPAGCSNLVAFVRNGGGYFGTCAGYYLAMSHAQGEKKSRGRIGMLPYEAQQSPYRGGAELLIRFTDKAGLLGLKPGSLRTVRYHGGPVPLPHAPVPGADIHEIATYACDGVYAFSTNTAPVMAGHPAVVAGTFGKGRLVCTSPHPESYTHTQDIIRGGLRYITGRAFRADYPQRTRGNLSVGFVGSRIRKDGAMLAARLYREPSLDLRAVAGETINYGELEHCDALVLPHPGKKSVTPLIRAFAENGGRIFAFGRPAELANLPKDVPNVVACKDATALRDALIAYAREEPRILPEAGAAVRKKP